MTGGFTEDWYREHQAKVARQRAQPPRFVDRDAAHPPAPTTKALAPPGGEGVEERSPHQSKQKRKRPEEDLQKQQVEYLEWALAPPWRFLHIPNQKGTRATWENKLLKAMGVQDGAADLLFLGPPCRFVWIENKAGKNGLSDAQKDWRDWCLAIGAQWYLCRSLDALVAACEDAGIPLRGKPA